MVNIPSAEEINQRYLTGASKAPSRYKEGIQRTNNWQSKAIAGEGLYAAKVQEAISTGRRANAIQNVSDSEWKQAASDKGSARIASGMQASATKRTKNFEPYRQALGSLELPAKQADPMANVDNRLKAVVQRMVDTKKSIKG